ncbi:MULTISPECIES: hypothetical protein [unclassified Endozoicomonas]|uniref:hypothetical protein n=1 Tax=unclassified Endozoicomonas TaxID=2644528 RepID=UPI003BB62F99
MKNATPVAFYGDCQAEEERNHKVHACEQFQALLGRSGYEQLLSSGEYTELFHRIAQLVGLTNFIQGNFEKPVFLDTIKENSPVFSLELYHFLWGEMPVTAL